MTMAPGLRKFALAGHLTFSIGWIGAVVSYLALGVSAVTSQDAQTVRAAWIAMELTGWWVILPSALATLLTGLIMSLGTPWGLFRHYWVLVSLALTILSTAVLVLHMPTVSSMANAARGMESASLGGLGGDLLHPGLGLVVLLVITLLNIYKPRGLTPYGWRKQRADSNRDTAIPGTPGWVKVFGIIGIVLVLFLVILLFNGGGRHGPGRHIPAIKHGAQQP